MNGKLHNDARIVSSWAANAAPWTAAVRGGCIESRKLVTDRAVMDVVLGCSPRSVLDLGCGEGWLARALNARGIRVLGIDVVPALIERARSAGGGEFRVASYEEIAAGGSGMAADAVVCNFSLLGREPVQDVFRAVSSLLNAGGAFIVQTLHPLSACGDLPYRDGWREGSWEGFDGAFTDPAPWYFRTLESWVALFARHGLRLLEMREPPHPRTGRPASVIFVAQPGPTGEDA